MAKLEKSNLGKRMLTQKTVEQTVARTADIKSQAESAAEPSESPIEFAEEKMQEHIVDTAATTGNVSVDTLQYAYRRYRVTKQNKAAAAKDAAETVAENAAKKVAEADISIPKSEQAAPDVRKDRIKRKLYETRARAAIAAGNSKQMQAEAEIVQTATKPLDEGYKQKFQKLRKQQIVRDAVKKHFEQKAKASAGGAITKAMPTVAPKLPAVSWKRALQERLSHTVKTVLLKIQALLIGAVKAAASALLSLLGAGGIVLVLAMVVGAAAAIIGSPMGILFADESGDPNAIPVSEIVQETNVEFAQAINDLVADHPECEEVDIQYDYEDGHTWASYWPEVLAVFAVDSNLNSDSDVVVIDDAKKDIIKATFWKMHQIDYEVEQVELPQEYDENDEPLPIEYKYILHITVSSRTVEELAVDKAFTADEMDILHELLSDEMRPMLAAMCGGIFSGGDGTLQWPLPGYSNLTTLFGAPDAFGRPGHRGVDIAAPAGTSIVAAHGGTVLISGWNDSYGNQVMLDDGAGTSTRYAHMTVQAVAAGETVAAGQVIGYVGSTGDSTGNHLHFELYLQEVRVNPLDYVGP